MDVNPEDETSYSTEYRNVILKYVENKYCAKHRGMPIIIPEKVAGSNIVPSAKASRFGESFYDPHDLSSDDEEDLTPKRMVETTPWWRDRAARFLSTARLYLNSPHEAQRTGGKLIPILIITTQTLWRLAVHFGYQISPIGGVNKRTRTQSTLSVPM